MIYIYIYEIFARFLNFTKEYDIQHGAEMYAVVDKSLLKQGICYLLIIKLII